ncbi:hypothetical protein D3C87_554210 [compost metagenome]|uniref:Uncharacterized protein n=1 Tax=Janthinobacterium lividum TaxID=29581 RepID=A0A031GTI4_9BURK|nr:MULTISPECIES: hypothetical protein [Janthinobacterium]EZP40138.1 hypothetical protein BW37_01813 [Janthinobacterium lividum]MBW3497805.1 hypothetical protein [Janthinobacterium sp. NKUCC08_JDC]TNC75556.1 hypothetical protein FHI69_18190 [Janthinobacterium lividum]STR26415.1 Uncharacterised protein [Janthinobacterium lividum]
MSTFTNTYSNDNDNYFSNLGRATRAFLGALLASKPYSDLAQKEVIGSSVANEERYVRPSKRDIALLNSEAARYENLMPNLASELRFLASRG